MRQYKHMRLAHSVCYRLAVDKVLMCSKLLQVLLSKNQPKTWSQYLRSPDHISWALRWAFSVLWLDLSSPTFPLITCQEGNTSLGMGCCCFHPEMHSWSSLWDQREMVSHRSRPTGERERSSPTCWRTPKWQSFSEVPVTFPGWGAVCNPIQVTHRVHPFIWAYDPLPHSSEAIQSNSKTVYQYHQSMS